jgi:hypothetical protein
MAADVSAFGRIYPYAYRGFADAEDREEAYSNLLREYGRTVWLLDMRLDPEGDTHFPQYRGEWLKRAREKQYRHAKGLGLVGNRLYHPESAIRKILEMVCQGESFVLFSDTWEHARMVERLVRTRAQEQHIALEDPYAIQPGDLCLLLQENVEVVICTRQVDVYYFYTESRDPNVRNVHNLPIGGYADLSGLRLLESGTYFCEECKRGARNVSFREKPGKKLCSHCLWRWELDNEE